MNNKKIYLVLAFTAMFFIAACDNTEKPDDVPTDGSVYVKVSVDPENGTKATIAENGGEFAFNKGDQIKIYDGTALYTGTTYVQTNEGVFLVPDAFNLASGAGFAGFPARLVSNITASGVTFSLPSSYSFSEVGGAYSDPSTDKPRIITPMMGTYNSSTTGNHITLKQAGSMVRFLLAKTGIGPGTLEFLFHNNVTGSVTLAATPSGSTGISSLAGGGPAIAVTVSQAEWDATYPYDYIYVSLPVPIGTRVDNSTNVVYITWTSASAGTTKTGTAIGPEVPVTLSRAQAYRLSASITTSLNLPSFKVAADKTVILAPGNLFAKIGELTDYYDSVHGITFQYGTVSEWKFGGPREFVGSDVNAGNYLFASRNKSCEGMWIDLLSFQGSSVATERRVQGVYNYKYNDINFAGNVLNESLYEGCWTTKNNNENPAQDGYIHISNGGEYNWRPLTNDEWIYLLAQRDGATVNGKEGVTCSRVRVSGVNGLLIYPDTDGAEIWNTTTMGSAPSERVSGSNGLSDPKSDGYGEFDNDHDNEYGDFLNYKVAYNWTSGSNPNYTPDQLEAMRAMGIVFLPAVGCRFQDSISHPDERGYYWSSTASGHSTQYAFYMGPFETQLCPGYPVNRHAGRNVRLVREIIAPLVITCNGTSFEISCSSADVTIYYEKSTTDLASVSTPTTSSDVYSGPVSLGGETTYVKAYAIKTGCPDSPVYSATCNYVAP